MTNFQITKKSKEYSARLGKIFTPHGIVRTPNFMPILYVGHVYLKNFLNRFCKTLNEVLEKSNWSFLVLLIWLHCFSNSPC